jgi:phosphoglycolate phosphatase-like HAD superfamily hydrolase
MSLAFPLLFDANTDARELGEQFRKIQELDRSRDLIDPYQGGYGQKDPYAGDPNSTEVKQVPNMSSLIPGASEEDYATLTTMMAAQNLRRELNTDPLTTTDLMERNLDTNLDPRLEQAVYAESLRTASNIGSEQAENFVDEMRQGVQSFYEEKNLYNMGPVEKVSPVEEFLQAAAIRTGDANNDGQINTQDLAAAGLEGIFRLAVAEEAAKKEEAAKVEKETIMKGGPKPTPTGPPPKDEL